MDKELCCAFCMGGEKNEGEMFEERDVRVAPLELPQGASTGS